MISGDFHKTTGRARFPLRKSGYCLFLFCVAVVLAGAMFFHSLYQRQADVLRIREVARVVETLELTDLCLFTEARYTRHLSQADLYSAFQDHPVALEHFPSGSFAGPPSSLRRLHGRLD